MGILKLLKRISNLFRISTSESLLPLVEISEDFRDKDRITRTIFSPINLKGKKKDRLNTNIFVPPLNSEDISVNRLDYADSTFIKKISKLIEQPEKLRTYCGISVLNVFEIWNAKAKIEYTPNYINNDKAVNHPNPCHSDIKIGHIVEKGVPLPAEISLKINELVSNSRVYIDPNPSEDAWSGNNLR